MTLAELQNFDFKSLDPKSIGSWPLPIRAVVLVAIFVAVCGAGYYFMVQESLAALDRAQRDEQSLRADFSDKARKATNLDAYKAQLAQMDRQFGELLRQLPGRTEIENLVEEIAREALSSNLTQELFKPESEQLKEFYAELPITMRLTGNYHEFGEFASRIAALPRIVTLHDIKIAYDERSKAATGVLVMNVVAKTYRYLEPDEIAAQQAAAKSAADKRKKGRKK